MAYVTLPLIMFSCLSWIRSFRIDYNACTLCLSPTILHTHHFQFFLGRLELPRESENNIYTFFFLGGGGGVQTKDIHRQFENSESCKSWVISVRNSTFCIQFFKQFSIWTIIYICLEYSVMGSARHHSTFISNFNKQTESFRRLQSQALSNNGTKFFGACTGVYLKGLQWNNNVLMKVSDESHLQLYFILFAIT